MQWTGRATISTSTSSLETPSQRISRTEHQTQAAGASPLRALRASTETVISMATSRHRRSTLIPLSAARKQVAKPGLIGRIARRRRAYRPARNTCRRTPRYLARHTGWSTRLRFINDCWAGSSYILLHNWDVPIQSGSLEAHFGIVLA